MKESFLKRAELFGDKKDEILLKINKLSEKLSPIVQYLYEKMPISDVANYDYEVFLDFAKHGLMLKEKYNYSDEIFFNYVLFHRINNEEIKPCRKLFYDEIIKELGDEAISYQRIIDINYFCASKVTYKSSDDRTASSLDIYNKGHGRCGEESTFVCNVYRAMGIPARQVYAPLWSHCDDNHAWTEVLFEDKWYFLGACEPEEVLNRGWFLNASSRAMLTRYITFDPLEDSSQLIAKDGGVYLYNNLETYAKTTNITIKVIDVHNNIIDTKIDVSVLNYSSILKLTSIYSLNGIATLKTGLGTLILSATYKGLYAQVIFNTEEAKVVLKLSKKTKSNYEFIFKAPKDSVINTGYITEEERNNGISKFKVERDKRLKRQYKENIISDKKIKWLISEKDRSDVDNAIVNDHIQQYTKSNEILDHYIYSPRIYIEKLSKYRTYIKQYFENIEVSPIAIWNWIEKNIKTEIGYIELITTPVGCLMLKAGSELSKKILFVAIMRTFNIPSRLVNEEIEYFDGKKFISISEKQFGYLTILHRDDLVYMSNISIEIFENNEYHTLKNIEIVEKIRILAGDYRIVVTNRLPNGNIFVKVYEVEVIEHQVTQIELKIPEILPKDMLNINKIQDFQIETVSSEKLLISSIVDRNLVLWIEEGKEPTEHILNEIYDNYVKYIDIDIVFVLRNETKDPNIIRVLNVLPKINVVYDREGLTVEAVARKMYVDPEKLPLIVLFDKDMCGVYANSGYNVGTSDMILKVYDMITA